MAPGFNRIGAQAASHVSIGRHSRPPPADSHSPLARPPPARLHARLAFPPAHPPATPARPPTRSSGRRVPIVGVPGLSRRCERKLLGRLAAYVEEACAGSFASAPKRHWHWYTTGPPGMVYMRDFWGQTKLRTGLHGITTTLNSWKAIGQERVSCRCVVSSCRGPCPRARVVVTLLALLALSGGVCRMQGSAAPPPPRPALVQLHRWWARPPLLATPLACMQACCTLHARCSRCGARRHAAARSVGQRPTRSLSLRPPLLGTLPGPPSPGKKGLPKAWRGSQISPARHDIYVSSLATCLHPLAISWRRGFIDTVGEIHFHSDVGSERISPFCRIARRISGTCRS